MSILLEKFKPHIKKYFETDSMEYREGRTATIIDNNFKIHKDKLSSGMYPTNLEDEELYKYKMSLHEINKMIKNNLVTKEIFYLFLEEIEEDVKKEKDLNLFV